MDDDFSTELVGHLSLAEHFGISLPTGEDSKKLKYIWERCSQDELTQLENRLGSSSSRLDQVYRHLRLKEL